MWNDKILGVKENALYQIMEIVTFWDITEIFA